MPDVDVITTPGKKIEKDMGGTYGGFYHISDQNRRMLLELKAKHNLSFSYILNSILDTFRWRNRYTKMVFMARAKKREKVRKLKRLKKLAKKELFEV